MKYFSYFQILIGCVLFYIAGTRFGSGQFGMGLFDLALGAANYLLGINNLPKEEV